MPCNHKFQSYLQLEKIDFKPTTLIVGTFNPEWPEGNTAQWFHGRTHDLEGKVTDCFWDILPRLYGEASLINATPAEWKHFCHNKQIAITDLISCIDDADADNAMHNDLLAGGSDQGIAYNFDDFDFVNIVRLLRLHPTIKNIYLTRAIADAFWRHLWNPVMHYCHTNDIRERRLLPHSEDAVYQHGMYNTEHSAEPIQRVEDYLLMRWQQEWHV